MMKETGSTSEGGHTKGVRDSAEGDRAGDAPGGAARPGQGYFPVPALRHLEEPYLTMLQVALCPPKAKEPELLQPQPVEILRSRPNDHRTRTGANSFWVLRVLEMYPQADGVS
jgi:asparagine synthase (glutamine-hydrolysing)